MLNMLASLRRLPFLTVPGLLHLAEALATTGLNLMALLRVAARTYPDRIALVDDRAQVRYGELWAQAEATAVALANEFGLKADQRMGIACRNHAAALKALVAGSRLGAHVFLINPEQSGDQIRALDERLRFNLFVYDEELAPLVAASALQGRALPAYHSTAPSLDGLAARYTQASLRLRKARAGSIVVLTSGTTGRPKTASRTPSVLNSLAPLLALLARARLDAYRSLYVATPIYHGYGLAMLLAGLGLGATLYVTRRFKAARSCALVAQHRIEAVTLVPLQLQRMLNLDAGALASLRCIIAGSAPLSEALAREALARLGPTLFNLYGTSEAGFSLMASPELLRRKPGAVGRPLPGVRVRVMEAVRQAADGPAVGRLCVRSAWSVRGKGWIETGDLAYRDRDGDLILCGRVDDMIVSGGENVYPIELESVLQQHPAIEAVAVVGVPDAEFGQRLKAVVVTRRDAPLDRADLLAWLKPRVARHQMPVAVEFRDELPYTTLGKLNRKALAG